MWRANGGAILIICGVAAFIEAHRHIPVPTRQPTEAGLITPASGLSPTAYDLLRLGGWALVILGTITVIVGLIRYAVQYAAAKPLTAAPASANGASRTATPATAKGPDQGAIKAAQPWDEGAHGEAVQPGRPR